MLQFENIDAIVVTLAVFNSGTVGSDVQFENIDCIVETEAVLNKGTHCRDEQA